MNARGYHLEDVVAALSQARNAQNERRDEQKRRQRPSSAALSEIVRGLRAALFPAHFGVSDFTEAGINSFVAEVLDSNLQDLEEQVRHALVYASADVALAAERIAGEAYAIVSTFAERLPHVRALLEKDVRAALEGDPAASTRAEVLFCYPGITAITHHRLAHELYGLGVPLIARMVSEIARSMTGIDIHPAARIGESVLIDHGTGVVIGETAIIGSRVRMYQGVTLGARNFLRDDRGALVKGVPRHPILEDDVVVYAGASILGRITVGRGSVIGGNVWLTHDVPPHSVVTQAKSQGHP